MNGRCEEYDELLSLRLLDSLEPDEAARLDEHLQTGCPRCAAELAATGEALNLLPFALAPELPSESAKARLMSRVRAESASAPGQARRSGSTTWRIAAALLGGALLGAFAAGTALNRRNEAQVAELHDRLDRQSAELADLKRQVFQSKDAIRMASAPGVHVFDLAGQPGAAGASARVFWDPKSTTWQLYAANLPAPPAGKTYQLWLITATHKISAGTFPQGEAGALPAEAAGQIQVPPEAGTVVAAAVTDEPAGGSPQPTGSILLLGKI
jgi:anti-sigma-K factor RskA